MRLCGLFLAVFAAALSGQTVPPSYQDLYAALNDDITTFSNAVNALPPRASSVAYAGQLLPLVPSQGTSPTNNYTEVLAEVDSLKALGVSTIAVHVDFPVLYAPYYQNPGDYQQVLTQYQQLFADIRARGLKIFVISVVAGVQPGVSETNYLPYYDSLTLDQYQAGRAQTAVNVAQLLHPDYLSVLTEPDTEASLSGKSDVGTVTGSQTLLTVILNGLQQAGVHGIPIGAGVGSWTASYQSYIQNFTAMGVQFIDIHVYPLNQGVSGGSVPLVVIWDFLARALTIADMAQAAGKMVTVSEFWAYKIRDSELGILSRDQVFARDPFSFWAPLDTKFLQTMVAFAQKKNVVVLAPYWTTYFHAYLDYNTVQSMSPSEISTLATSQMRKAVLAGLYTSTAVAYSQAIVPVPDTAAPSVPANLTVTPVAPDQMLISWNPSTDNVGPAGYVLYGGGQLLRTVGTTTYLDTGLRSGVQYSYAVAAYDLRQNLSARSPAVSARTLDNVPPSVPTGLAAAVVSATQINLSWKVATDNVRVTSYVVYRGPSPASLNPLANVTTLYYHDTPLVPSTTFYYAVAAVDASYNTSARSAPVSATTLADTTPPTRPTNLKATAVSMTQINLSWTASTDNVAVAGYAIYRGTTRTNLILVGSTTATSYSDTASLRPNTTYYYAVVASDLSKNMSPQSALASARTLVDTSPPT